jgi:hypothetical protein
LSVGLQLQATGPLRQRNGFARGNQDIAIAIEVFRIFDRFINLTQALVGL